MSTAPTPSDAAAREVPAGTAADLPWRCRCGEVTGRLSPPTGRHLRIVCHCRDCQAFAHALGRAGDVLDARGGTDVLGLAPDAFAFTGGHGRVAALRLYPRGLYRWYAGCCSTPIANTGPSRLVPHLGLVAASAVGAAGEAAVDAAFGPVRGAIHGRSAPGGVPPGAHPGVPLSMIPPGVAMFAGRWARGAHRRSAFFDADGAPVAAARVLDEAERRALPPLAQPRRERKSS